MPTPPRNGMVVVPTTSHLSMALYQCKVKNVYLFRHQIVFTRMDTSWRGTTPPHVCSATGPGPPPAA